MGPRGRGRAALAGGHDNGFAARRAAGRTLGASVPGDRAARRAGRARVGDARGATRGVGGRAARASGTTSRASGARPRGRASRVRRQTSVRRQPQKIGRPAGGGPHGATVGADRARSVGSGRTSSAVARRRVPDVRTRCGCGGPCVPRATLGARTKHARSGHRVASARAGRAERRRRRTRRGAGPLRSALPVALRMWAVVGRRATRAPPSSRGRDVRVPAHAPMRVACPTRPGPR